MQNARQVGSIENGVLIGHDDDLFLATGAHSVLDYASGKLTVDEASYRHFAENIARRHDWAARHNVGYLHVIFPDKQSLSPRTYPWPTPLRLGELYLDRCRDVAGQILYLAEPLQRLDQRCFMRTDTHLSDRGWIASAVAIAERLTGRSLADHAGRLLAAVTQTRPVCGDLGTKLTHPATADEQFLVPGWPVQTVSNNLSGNNGLVDIWYSNTSVLDARLLIFGDSFARGAARILSVFFREILFARTPFFHEEMVEQMQPDHVITQNVERYLAWVAPDEHRPCFAMYPYLGPAAANYHPSSEFAKTYSAMLSYPRKPYQDLVARWGT